MLLDRIPQSIAFCTPVMSTQSPDADLGAWYHNKRAHTSLAAGSAIPAIVPYGLSANQVASKSRFAREARASNASGKPDKVAQVLLSLWPSAITF